MHWWVFGILVVGLLLLDLGIFHKRPRAIGMREALLWSLFWIALSLLFNLYVYYVKGPEFALQFLTGYIIEKTLSMDNLFVFLLIFSYFKVPAEYQYRVLFEGIIGALIMRFILIFAGIALIARFQWLIYVLGAFLCYTGIRFYLQRGQSVDLERNPILRLCRKFFPVTAEYHGKHHFIKLDGINHVTPLFLVLVLVETTDLVFALDSVPAIFAVSSDSFVIFTSNVFAVLGLRALYFVLAGAIEKLRSLKSGLALILVAIGLKMLMSDIVRIPISVTLFFVVIVIAATIFRDFLSKPRSKV